MSGRKLLPLVRALIILVILAVTTFISIKNKGGLSNICVYSTATIRQDYDSSSNKDCGLVLEKVDTPSSREKGLSGRDIMPNNQGMLFVYENTGTYCIWMKDMKFAIDILWLNSDAKVIKVLENVRPDTFPQQFCSDNSSYVIELNASESKTHNLHLGSEVLIKS